MQLRLLRGQRLEVDGQAVPIAGRKERLLLTLLAVENGRDVGEDRLIDTLWEGRPPRTAVKSLQSHIWRLRGSLAEAGSTIEITRGARGYRVDIAPGDVDIEVAEDHVRAGREHLARGAYDAAAAAFDAALALWSGRSLGELADIPAFVAEAARLDELRVSAHESRIEADLAQGRHVAVIPELELLCAEHPFRESLVALRMRALYRSGRQADALAVLRDLRERLRDELGLGPSARLAELEHAILVQDPSLDAEASSRSVAPSTAKTGALRVMLVDDHPVWRDAMRTVLEQDGSVAVVGEAGDGETAVTLAAQTAPGLVLMDLHLPGIGGVEATRRILDAVPETPILVLSASEHERDVLSALQAGAMGYVLKTGSGQEVAEAVRRVAKGEAVFSASLSPVVLGELRKQ